MCSSKRGDIEGTNSSKICLFLYVCSMFAKWFHGVVDDLTEGWCICEKSLELCICLWPKFVCPEVTPCVDKTLKSYYYCLFVFFGGGGGCCCWWVGGYCWGRWGSCCCVQGGHLPWGCAWALLCVVRWGRCTFCSGGWAVAVGWTLMWGVDLLWGWALMCVWRGGGDCCCVSEMGICWRVGFV